MIKYSHRRSINAGDNEKKKKNRHGRYCQFGDIIMGMNIMRKNGSENAGQDQRRINVSDSRSRNNKNIFKHLRMGYGMVDMPDTVEGIWVVARLLSDRSLAWHHCRMRRGCNTDWARVRSRYYRFLRLRVCRKLFLFVVGRVNSGYPVHGKGVVGLHRSRFRIGCLDDRRYQLLLRMRSHSVLECLSVGWPHLAL